MNQPSDLLMPALARARMQDFHGALAEAERGLALHPADPGLLGFAALCALQLGQPELAIPLLHRQLAASPDDQAARLNLATALTGLGREGEALELVAEQRDNPRMARLAGYLFQQSGQMDAAIAAYRVALDAFPDDWESWNNLGNCLAGEARCAEAVTAFENAINRAPDGGTPEIFLNLCHALNTAENREKRLHAATEADRRWPDNHAVVMELGLAQGAADRMPEAEATLKRAAAMESEFGEARLELGLLYELANRLDDLDSLIAESEGLGETPELKFLQAWSLRRRNRFEEAHVLAAQIPDTINPIRSAQLRAELADRLGHYQQAFEHYIAMNAASAAATPAAEGPTFREIVSTQTETMRPQAAPTIVLSDGLPQHPVFIVGSPRSGTTLLDTLLGGMPELQIFEELPTLVRVETEFPDIRNCEDSAIVAAARRRYFEVAEQLQEPTAGRRIVDKMPLHMNHMPEIARLFPDAAVVLVERHPCDAVLSCYMSNFTLNHAMRSYSDLEEAARAYDAVFANFAKARQILPLNVHEVRYERMIADLETEMRSLLEFLGLPWRPEVLDNEGNAKSRGVVRTASYSQITQPLYARSVGRWQNYRAHLEPVLPILRPWIDAMGYSIDPA